jgi:hypothetical protein
VVIVAIPPPLPTAPVTKPPISAAPIALPPVLAGTKIYLALAVLPAAGNKKTDIHIIGSFAHCRNLL